MDDDESTCESPMPEQRAVDSTEPGETTSNEKKGDAGRRNGTNNLNAMMLHCNESSCDGNNIDTEKERDRDKDKEKDNDNSNSNNNSNRNSNACQFIGHHYHYIEYPGMYYQSMNSQTDNVTMPPNTTSNSNATYHYCVCACSSGGRMQISSKPSSSPVPIPPTLQHQHHDHHHHHQQQQQLPESRLAVAAIVHHHQPIDADCGLRTKSQQSLLSHSYQMLNIPAEKNGARVSSCAHSKLHINCEMDGDCNSTTCSCAASPGRQQQAQLQTNKRCKDVSSTLVDSMLATADEITVSESDNNGSLTKRKNMRESRVQKKINSWYAKNYNCNHIEIYSDGDDVDDSNHRNDAITTHDSLTNILDQRPPLPPRPQTIPAIPSASNTLNAHRPGSQSIKKYVVWCLVCGGFSCLLGALFLGVYFLLHSYTITVGNFETVPTFVPATLLILTGLCIMSLARRRNRYSYLIKLSGACGLTSALTCALVTVTTTVLHMSRLQALRECEYAQKTRTCTCYSDMIESQVDRVDKEGVRLVFDSLSDCGVVHGSLYSCLRAIFGLSVAGVLVAVFSCMLVYQLLSHERKKMYWEQLELRCRSLYTSHQQQHPSQGSTAHNMAALTSISARSAPICRCCEQCHAHRQLQLQTASYPWVDDSGEPRFWAGQPPGNFYSPNPGGEENNLHAPAGPNNRSRISSGWSWPRMPWQRSSTESGNRFRQIPSSPDSQYGFSSTNPSLGLAVSNVAVATAGEEEATAAAVAAVATATQRAAQAYNIVTGGGALPYGIWGPPPPYSDPNSPARRGYYQYMQPVNNMCASNRVGDNNGIMASGDDLLQQRPLNASDLNALAVGSTPNVGTCVAQRTFDHVSQRLCANDQIQSVYKSKENNVGATVNNNYGNTGSDSDVESVPTRFDRFSNTLPTRKIKKRVVDGSSSIAKCVGTGSRHQLTSHRINVQRVFPNSSNSTSENDADANSNTRPLNSHSLRYGKSSSGIHKDSRSAAYAVDGNVDNSVTTNRVLPNMMISDREMQLCNEDLESNSYPGKCDGNDSSTGGAIPSEDPTESEIYFADVSSCCNMSMKNDNCYEDSSRNAHQQHHQHHHQQQQQCASHNIQQSAQRTTSKQSQPHFRHHHHHQHERNNCSQSSNPRNNGSSSAGGVAVSSSGCCAPKDDHQVQHFGQRENSIRNRQNHTQARQGDNYSKKQNMIISNGDMSSDFVGASKLNSKTENSIPKDSSLHSMCSIESEAKTECTDLSPLTPCSNKNPTEMGFQSSGNNIAVPQTLNANNFSNFIASFPYASESKFHEAHRRFTKHMHDNLNTTNKSTETVQEAHYEIINDDNKMENPCNKTFSLRVPSAMASSHQYRSENLNSNCNYEKSPLNRVAHNRNTKSKDNLDGVWSSSDASGSSHNRQRL